MHVKDKLNSVCERAGKKTHQIDFKRRGKMMGYGKVAAFAELGHFLYFNYVIDMITIKSMYYLGIHPYLLHRND